MAKRHTPTDTYTTSVHVTREVEKALKAEQARRVIQGKEKPTISALATELLSGAILAL
jgi:hypothetical protein